MEPLVLGALIGVSIGWLVGLSTSPVLGIVLTSVMGTLAALSATLPAVDAKALPKLKFIDTTSLPAPFPARRVFCILLVAMAIGATCGLWARTHNLFSPSEKALVARWTDIGIDQKVVAKRIFDAHFVPGQAMSSRSESILFSATADECNELQGLVGPDLRNALLSSTNSELVELPNSTDDDARLIYLIQTLCQP